MRPAVIRMLRALIAVTIVLMLQPPASGQAQGVLHVRVTLVDAQQTATPVPRHVLLVSDNPATAEPRRVLTGIDGTVDLRLRPGTYTVESDRPVAFNGRAYQWTQMIEIAAGRDATLELTAGNAESEPVTAATTGSAAAPALEDDPSFLLPRWQDSVVTLWTPTARMSGFVIDAKGLIATSRRAIGEATSIEVQLTPAIKVAARVLFSQRAEGAAILWIDPAAIGAVKPIPLACGATETPAVKYKQEIFTIGATRPGQKEVTSADVVSVATQAIGADFRLRAAGIGGPVFSANGTTVGIASVIGAPGEARQDETWVVPAAAVCRAVASAESTMRTATPPSPTPLPVEPSQPVPRPVLDAAARRGAPAVTPYQVTSADFEITFITPALAHITEPRSDRLRMLTDFANWSEYVADSPPVLLVRVTPKFTEGFWKMVGRAAASTQGVALPPMKSFKPGFARMQAYCGSAEATPIHPFILEQRISERELIHEGLYVFDPAAIGPQCGTVKLVLYSEKDPQKGDTRIVDPKVLEQIAKDLMAAKTPPAPEYPAAIVPAPSAR